MYFYTHLAFELLLTTLCSMVASRIDFLVRHQGILPDTEIVFSVKNDDTNSLQYHMSLGKTHQVTGSCANKKEGKQLASQALIKVKDTNIYHFKSLLVEHTGITSICE